MKMNNMLAKAVIEALKAGAVPFLIGEVGIGKSTWIQESIADELCTKVFTLSCNELGDKTDLTGTRSIKDEKTGKYKQYFFPHATIADAIAYANENKRETPILFMDEINRTTADITSACLSIPTKRAIGNEDLPKNLKIIVAGNDKGNITALDEASVTRFITLPVEPDIEIFLEKNPTLHPTIKTVLLKNPEFLFMKPGLFQDESDPNVQNEDEVLLDELMDEKIQQLTTCRTITALSNWLNQFSSHELMTFISVVHEDESMLLTLMKGFTGNTPFTNAVYLEISTSGLSNSASSASIVPKPNFYDTMKQFTTRQEIQNFIMTLSDNEKESTLLYALHEPANNEHIIIETIACLNEISKETKANIISLSQQGQIDEINAKCLENVNHKDIDLIKSLIL